MEQMIDKYQVKRLIGTGGMAEVYEVESSGPGGFTKRLCIKKIRKEVSARQDFVSMFEAEARIVSRLQHSNIVQVFEFSRDNHSGELYLVMEYVDGLDLNSILKQASDLGLQVPLDFAVYVLESLLSALQCAHSLKTKGELTPVIHRDISPHNLLITTDGVVKLADFGIAKMKGMSDATETGVLKGKLAYMSPEQATAGRIPITPATDLFSAGVVFWETATCERLFKATMEQELLVKVLNFNDASLPYYSSQFNMFLSGLLAHDPVNRFSSAEAALRALRKIGIAPCRKSDAAHLVQKIKALKETADSAALRQMTVTTRKAVIGGVESSEIDTSSVELRSPNESDKNAYPWKRTAAAVVATMLLSAFGTWALVTMNGNPPAELPVVKEESPAPNPIKEKEEKSAPSIQPPAVPEQIQEPTPEQMMATTPATTPVQPIETPSDPSPDAKPEPASPGPSEATKEQVPAIEAPFTPTPKVEEKTKSKRKKSKIKTETDESDEKGKGKPPDDPIPMEYDH